MGTRAEIREDFAKRLFAVAISVGFATTIARMEWIKLGDFPTHAEVDQILILITGLIATALSWDGYLASIAAKPLNSYPRYIIDIVLIFIYMILLITSDKPRFFIPIFAVVFLLYALWDFLSVREHIGQYKVPPLQATNQGQAKVSQIASIYYGGLVNSKEINRGQ